MPHADRHRLCLLGMLATLIVVLPACTASQRPPMLAALPQQVNDSRRVAKTAGTASSIKPRHAGSNTSDRLDESNTSDENAKASLQSSTDNMAEIVRQVQELNLAPDDTERIVADLKQTDPAMWPQLVATLKAGAAYRQKLQEKSNGDADTQDRPQDSSDADSPATQIAAADEEPPAVSEAIDEGRDSHAGESRDDENNPRVTSAADSPAPDKIAQRRQPKKRKSTQLAGSKKPARLKRPRTAAMGDAAPDTSPAAEEMTAEESVVVSDEPAAASAPDSPEAKTVNTSKVAPATFERVEATPPRDCDEQIAGLILQLEDQARSSGKQPVIDRQIQLRLLYAMSGRREEALRPVSGLSPGEQDFWAKELYGLTALLAADRQADTSARTAEAALHLSDATARLRDMAALLVRNLTFCTEVHSYGVYKPFEKYVFHPGQEVLLYAEVENFKSEVVPEGYKTVLSSRYQIFDKEGKQIDDRDFGVTEDVCHNRRRDFFIRYQFNLPARIYDGEYSIKLTVEDAAGEKIGQSSVDFAIKEAKSGR